MSEEVAVLTVDLRLSSYSHAHPTTLTQITIDTRVHGVTGHLSVASAGWLL